MKYCQGTKCHEYRTQDRIRGMKGSKHYQTRRKTSFYYADNFCSLNCMYDWINEHIEHALDHFGRTTAPKKVMCDQAWYKDRSWRDDTFYLVNDLLGQKIRITERQFDDDNITQPNNLSQ